MKPITIRGSLKSRSGRKARPWRGYRLRIYQKFKEHSNKLSIGAVINIIDEPAMASCPKARKYCSTSCCRRPPDPRRHAPGSVFRLKGTFRKRTFRRQRLLPWLRLLGFLQKHKVRRRRKKPILLYPAGSPADEYVKVIRTGLIYLMENSSVKSVLITSPGKSEGKTTFALNLAVSAAQLGKRVLLVDCSFRKPCLGRLCCQEKCEKDILRSGGAAGKQMHGQLLCGTEHRPGVDSFRPGSIGAAPGILPGCAPFWTTWRNDMVFSFWTALR